MRIDMAAGDMAELVGDDALHLVDVVGRGDQARLDVDHLAAGDEGVDLRVVDQDDLDACRVEPGGLDQRPGHVAEQQLGLAVAQDRLRRGRPRRGEGRAASASMNSRASAGQSRASCAPLSHSLP